MSSLTLITAALNIIIKVQIKKWLVSKKLIKLNFYYIIAQSIYLNKDITNITEYLTVKYLKMLILTKIIIKIIYITYYFLNLS